MSAMRRSFPLGLVLVAAALLPQAWGATGTRNSAPSGVILFSSFRDGSNGLYVVSSDGSGLKKLAVSGFEPGGDEPAWSPDGSKLAFLSSDLSLVVDRGDGSRTLRTIKPGGAFSWSPDGRRIVTIDIERGEGSALDIVDVATGKRTFLTTPPAGANDGPPVWSPDGRRIAFLRYRPDVGPSSDLYVVRPDGSGRRLLSGGDKSSVFWPPSWSPDGKRLAFLARDGLLVINVNGTGKHRLSRDQLVPVWSPRGDEIALRGTARGETGVFLIRPDGRGLRQVFRLPPNYYPTVHWSPGGRSLSVEKPENDFRTIGDIFTIDVASGRSRRVTQSWRYGYGVSPEQWHPRARSTKELKGTPVSWAIPTDSIADGGVLSTRAPIDQLVADGQQVAISLRAPVCTLEVWNPAEARPVRFPAGPACGGAPIHPFADLALGGDRVAFGEFSHQVGTNARGIVTGTRERPALQPITGLCPPTVNPYYCIRPPIGDFKAQASLFVFDSWEGPDFYCANPCPPPKRNGGLWRIDGTRAVEIASSSGALTPLSVDAGRILVDHENGTLELVRSDGTPLQTFHVYTGDFLGAKLQGPDVVILKHTTISDYDADTGALLREWPLPPGDRQLEDVQNGIAVYVSGADVHLLRLSDGKDAVIHAPSSGPVYAQLDASGLFYCYAVDDAQYPGRVVFVPFDRLPLR